jgi:predicted nucleic acid-binding protein
MGWLDSVRGTTVALDSAPLIDFIEEHPRYLRTVLPFFQAWDKGELQVVTSAVTLVEVLVLPLRQGNVRVAERYRHVLTRAAGLQTVPVTVTVAEEAARLRSIHTLKTPDAIQLATATIMGASAILTNDARWPVLPSLRLLQIDNLASSTP